MALGVAYRPAAIALALLAVIGIAAYVVYTRTEGLPAGLAAGNGRLEATEVDVATKLGGRLSAVAVQEGDNVERGQVVAELDAAEIKAQWQALEAQVHQARKSVEESRAAATRARAEAVLAEKTLQRSRELVGRGFISNEKLDRDHSGLEGARAGVVQAHSRVAEAQAAMTAAQARSDSVKVTLDDAQLRSPLAGRVLYRLSQPGEVLPAGGKVLTLLDMADIYMSIYLPAAEAGQVRIGDEARVVLDALPAEPIPARVIFVAPRAQFTPKEVETRSEREKLMFRVKIQVTPAWLQAHAGLAKPGMPGVAYVRIDPAANWPPSLLPR